MADIAAGSLVVPQDPQTDPKKRAKKRPSKYPKPAKTQPYKKRPSKYPKPAKTQPRRLIKATNDIRQWHVEARPQALPPSNITDYRKNLRVRGNDHGDGEDRDNDVPNTDNEQLEALENAARELHLTHLESVRDPSRDEEKSVAAGRDVYHDMPSDSSDEDDDAPYKAVLIEVIRSLTRSFDGQDVVAAAERMKRQPSLTSLALLASPRHRTQAAVDLRRLDKRVRKFPVGAGLSVLVEHAGKPTFRTEFSKYKKAHPLPSKDKNQT
jgi:hypothetical protein